MSDKPQIEPIAFDNAFGRLADELDPYTEGAKAGVMATLLSAYSGYIGHDTRVETGRGTSPLACWFVLIGVSGKGRKGATARIAVPVIKAAFRKWGAEHLIKGIPATGLGMMTELTEHGDNPLFVLEEEMDTFINNAKKDTKVGVYLRKSWDGETLAHKTAKSDLVVDNPHFGFVGHCQPKNWGAITGSSDATGGTYNRFGTILVEKSKTVPVFGGPDPSPVIEQAGKQLRMMSAWGQSTGLVTVPSDVAKVFEDEHRPVCESLTEGNEALGEMAERSLAYMIRISALYALGDLRDAISVADLDSALALVKYMVESVRHVLPQTGGESPAQKLLRYLEIHGEATKSEVWDVVGRNMTNREVEEILRQLPQVTVTKGKSSGGRPPIIFRLGDGLTAERDIDLIPELEGAPA